jgi:preprotein translocase subunit SecD
MNQYPLWRYLLILAVLVVGVIYALPNLFPDEPALQISPRRAEPMDQALQDKVEAALHDAGIAVAGVERSETRLLLRFRDLAARGKAQPLVSATVDDQRYIVALNMAATTPAWLRKLGARSMYLGLDLRGGVHFLMEVDMAAVRVQTDERFVSDLRSAFREGKVRYRSIAREAEGGIKVRFLDEEMKARGAALIASDFADLELTEGAEPSEVRLTVRSEVLEETRRTAIKQNLTTLRNRVNEFGVAEPVIQQQGEDRIVVQLPGIEDTAEAKKILGATATLEFRMVDLDNDVQAAVDGRVPVASKLYHERNGQPVLLQKKLMLTGEYIIDASSGIEQQSGSPAVFITLDSKGARLFSRATRDQIGRPMAVVYIEQRKGRPVEEVINIATIRDELGKRFQITGLDSTEEARTLALLLRAGALAAPIEIVEERTVGPSLGQENIDKGVYSALIGTIGVFLFMVVWYKTFGMIANVGLVINVTLLVALLSGLQATLTLPGIAGIVLTIGMAVDANVLIFERIREELMNGNSPQSSITAGYDKALWSIADSNITTLIAAAVLFNFGTGPIKGFAVTLTLGILTSMFTAITGTRAIVNLMYGGRRRPKSLWI